MNEMTWNDMVVDKWQGLRRIRLWGICILSMFSVLSVQAQHQLPRFVDFTSEESDTLTWADEQGVHFLQLKKSEMFLDEAEMVASHYLNVTHWLESGESRLATWHYADSIVACYVDVEAKFLAAPRFTDLDEDGVYEVWFITQLACKGDISPSRVQVVMVDKEEFFQLDAEQKLIFPNGVTDGGAYQLGSFVSLPEAYQTYAVEYLFRNYTFDYGKHAAIPKDGLRYVWKKGGIPLYATPDTSARLHAQLSFGQQLEILDVLEHAAPDTYLYRKVLPDHLVDEYSSVYRTPAQWVFIEADNQQGYVLDSYLLPRMPPQPPANNGAFLLDDYLGTLSAVVSQEYIGESEAFCYQNITTYENNTQLVFTDFGPCEQCGHTQHVFRIPNASLREGVVIATVFLQLSGMPEDSLLLLKQGAESLTLEGTSEYGHAYQIHITEDDDGLMVVENHYL